jgi:guanylate kinase
MIKTEEIGTYEWSMQTIRDKIQKPTTQSEIMMSKLFVVSAPSGTGKTTLNSRIMNDFPIIEIAISHTTRKKRSGEIEGLSYHFVTRDYFQTMIRHGELLEWAEVFGNFYGTSRRELDRIFAKHHHVLLEIDVQGCQTVLRAKPDAITVFILPPSIETLWHRLEQRGTDSEKERWKRLIAAKNEISLGHLYEHFIINDHMERAYGELKSVLIDGNHSTLEKNAGIALCKKLVNEFETSPLLQSLRLKFGP